MLWMLKINSANNKDIIQNNITGGVNGAKYD